MQHLVVAPGCRAPRRPPATPATPAPRRVAEPHVAQGTATGPSGSGRASGRSVIIGFRSSTSKTRSNDTSAVITSTRALASAVIGV